MDTKHDYRKSNRLAWMDRFDAPRDETTTNPLISMIRSYVKKYEIATDDIYDFLSEYRTQSPLSSKPPTDKNDDNLIADAFRASFPEPKVASERLTAIIGLFSNQIKSYTSVFTVVPIGIKEMAPIIQYIKQSENSISPCKLHSELRRVILNTMSRKDNNRSLSTQSFYDNCYKILSSDQEGTAQQHENIMTHVEQFETDWVMVSSRAQ